jgi:Reverse transcriptase (RNA-dependent DNA polymerase)
MLVIRKPNRPSYSDPGAYRPIALLDTIGKILSACVAEDLSKYAELHNLLPPNHFGCRPGRTTTDTLHYVITYIKDAWRRGEVVGALFLDIKAAFPSIILKRLIHNMRRRGVPRQYMDWIKSKVKGRTTQIIFNDFTSNKESLLRGMDQGCPLSGIAFQFYNADLLDITHKDKGEDSIAVVDDTTILARGADLKEACEKLKNIMTRQEGAIEWSNLHKCRFALNKFSLMGFTRRREKDSTRPGRTKPQERPRIS